MKLADLALVIDIVRQRARWLTLMEQCQRPSVSLGLAVEPDGNCYDTFQVWTHAPVVGDRLNNDTILMSEEAVVAMREVLGLVIRQKIDAIDGELLQLGVEEVA